MQISDSDSDSFINIHQTYRPIVKYIKYTGHYKKHEILIAIYIIFTSLIGLYIIKFKCLKTYVRHYVSLSLMRPHLTKYKPIKTQDTFHLLGYLEFNLYIVTEQNISFCNPFISNPGYLSIDFALYKP